MYFDGKEATKHTESDKRSGNYTFAKLPTIIVRSDTWLPCPFLSDITDHSCLSKKKSSRRIQHTYLTQKSSDKMTKKPFLVNKS